MLKGLKRIAGGLAGKFVSAHAGRQSERPASAATLYNNPQNVTTNLELAIESFIARVKVKYPASDFSFLNKTAEAYKSFAAALPAGQRLSLTQKRIVTHADILMHAMGLLKTEADMSPQNLEKIRMDAESLSGNLSRLGYDNKPPIFQP